MRAGCKPALSPCGGGFCSASSKKISQWPVPEGRSLLIVRIIAGYFPCPLAGFDAYFSVRGLPDRGNGHCFSTLQGWIQTEYRQVPSDLPFILHWQGCRTSGLHLIEWSRREPSRQLAMATVMYIEFAFCSSLRNGYGTPSASCMTFLVQWTLLRQWLERNARFHLTRRSHNGRSSSNLAL